MTNQTPTPYDTKSKATMAAIRYNRLHPADCFNRCVVVEGHGDGSWWTFPKTDAVDGGFSYGYAG